MINVSFIFQDLENLENPSNGAVFSNAGSLSQLLASFGDREPFIFELRGSHGFTLTIGVGEPLGFVQYSATDGRPPYLVAVADSPTEGESKSFLAGGQPTEVPSRWCLPINQVEAIVAEFLTTGERVESVSWEEI